MSLAQTDSSAATPANDRGAKAGGAVPPVNMANHFLECCKLNRYLTIAADAAAMAAIYSRDKLVAQAAVLPLGQHAKKLKSKRDRAAYERLFALIEAQALDERVRDSAHHLLAHGFREAEIKSIEAELNDQMSPARARYRQFLDIVRRMMDGAMSPHVFVEEFKSFTADVAGRLDFGIYSFCLDRLFGSLRIPLDVKQMLVGELLAFPPLVRRELLTNILVFPGQSEDMKRYVRNTVLAELGRSVAVEIELLEAYRQRRLTLDDLAGTA